MWHQKQAAAPLTRLYHYEWVKSRVRALIHELVTSNRDTVCSARTRTHRLPRECVAEKNNSSIIIISRVNFNTTSPTAMTRLTLPRLVLITAAGTLLACGGLAQAQGKQSPIITPFPFARSRFLSLSLGWVEWDAVSAAPPPLTRCVLQPRRAELVLWLAGVLLPDLRGVLLSKCGRKRGKLCLLPESKHRFVIICFSLSAC